MYPESEPVIIVKRVGGGEVGPRSKRKELHGNQRTIEFQRGIQARPEKFFFFLQITYEVQ